MSIHLSNEFGYLKGTVCQCDIKPKTITTIAMLTNAAENAENEDHDEKNTKALRLVYNILDAFTPPLHAMLYSKSQEGSYFASFSCISLAPKNPFCPSFLIPNISLTPGRSAQGAPGTQSVQASVRALRYLGRRLEIGDRILTFRSSRRANLYGDDVCCPFREFFS